MAPAWIAIATAGLAALSLGPPPALATDEIDWLPGQTFTKSVRDEDLQSTLNSLFAPMDIRASVAPGVDITVSYDFEREPSQSAFEQLIADYRFEYRYDKTSRIINVGTSSDTTQPQELIVLVAASTEEFKAAVDRLDLGGQVLADPITGIVKVLGSRGQVNQLTRLATQLDQVEIDRAQQEAARRNARMNLADLAAKQADAATRRQETEIRQRLIDQIRNQDVAVIPLRYASVGPTTTTFQGESVTVPGIDETLRAMLGDLAVDGVSATVSQDLFGSSTRLLDLPTIAIDRRTNSVLARGTPEAIERVRRTVRKLDVKVPMIQIEVLIVNTSTSAQQQLGIDWGGSFANNNTEQVSAAGNTGLANLASTTTNTGLDAASLLPAIGTNDVVASFIYKGTRNFLQAQIQALSANGEAQVLDSPRLVTLNNVAATIARSAQLFVPINTGESASPDLQEVTAGLTLSINPSVVPVQETQEPVLIRMTVNATNTAIGSIGTGGQVPVSGSEVQTEVVIPDGQTFIMGGLLNDTRTDNESGVPFFKDVPILGALFRADASQATLSETLFFITPKIVDQADLYQTDIASRRYVSRQEEQLREVRRVLTTDRHLLSSDIVNLREDE